MYVVLGASGNTGHVVAKDLLAAKKKVRVVGRNAERLQPLASLGAEIFVADVSDASALTRAFQNADAAYVMIPPDPTSPDPLAYQNQVSDAITTAVKDSGLKNVVALSSIGSDKPSGTGPVVGTHNLEQKLSSLENVNVLFLRAGYFMENTLPQAQAVSKMGIVAGPLRADLKVSMIATRDIGAAAADALIKLDFHGKETRELLGQRDLTYTEVAAIIGKAIGKPDLKYQQPPDQQVRQFLLQSGMSQKFADLLLELAAALNSGHMRALETRGPRNTTPTSFEAFVAEVFVPAYKRQAAAA